MLGNKKNVFWEALLLTGVVFIFGLLLGVAFESSRLDTINEFYAQSEISLMDVLALNDFIDLSDSSCQELIQADIDFANRIYEEARLLERYTSSERLNDNIQLTHRRYDVLRTFLWINTMKTREKCGDNFFTIVYLYEPDPEDLAKKATQNVWSRILFDLKQKKGDEIILIPIAVNDGVESTNSLANSFNISEVSELPAVIINDEKIIRKLTSVEDLEEYLD